MVVPRDPGDDVLAQPRLQLRLGQQLPADLQVHGVVHLLDGVVRDPDRAGPGHREPGGDAGHHPTQPAAQPPAEGLRADEQRRQVWRAVLADRELHVVDLADVLPVPVEDLPVEQVEPDEEDHPPAPVTIISGMAATAATTTTTRNTMPTALANRPLTWSPRYCRSLATTRIGREVSGSTTAPNT